MTVNPPKIPKDCPIAISLENIDVSSTLPEGVIVSESSLRNPVRNLIWEYINFTDSSVFSPAANTFTKILEETGTGAYTLAIPNTTEYFEFWTEERRRCLEGYEPKINGVNAGIKITGEHYFYLNYTLIDKRTKNAETGLEVKTSEFPSFFLMDYYYFLELERNENPEKYGLTQRDKKGMVVAKARRKGWSFKNAAGVVHKYSFFKKSYCIIASYYEEHCDATYMMAQTMLNFLAEYTEFGHPTLVNNKTMVESGWTVKIDGREIKKGYRSIIKKIVFKDSQFKAVGKSATRVLFEEAGVFENLIGAYTATEPLFKDGSIMIGIPLIFGTGGDMESATQDFSKMFYEPARYGLAAYENIYDINAVGKCGYFVDEMWYHPGPVSINGVIYQGIDKNGNPNRWAAEVDLDRERALKTGGDRKFLSLYITQWCKTPKEAFLIIRGNIFPVAELYERLSHLRMDDNYKYIGVVGSLLFDTQSDESVNGIRFLPDLKNELRPIFNYPLKTGQDKSGAVVIYEPPILVDGEVPKDLYILCHDPFAVESDIAESLGATYVMFSNKYPKLGHNRIVASWVGRPTDGNSMAAYNLILEKLSMYYGNAKIMFENDRGSVLDYFLKKKKLSLLAFEPGTVISKVLDKKSTGRIYGCTMGNSKMKQQGQLYLYDWLLESRGKTEDGKQILNLDLIPDPALLEELITYNPDPKFNFDRVSALFQAMMMLEDTVNKYVEVDESPTNEKHKLDFLINNKKIFPKQYMYK